jgi:exodeoxyribonuclease V alpha subunit
MANASTQSDRLLALRAAKELAAIDEELARGLARVGNEHNQDVLLGVALASRATRQGHVCLDLQRFAPSEVSDVRWPSVPSWMESLRKSVLVGDAAGFTPLVLEGERLYLRRYYRYETRLAAQLGQRIEHVDNSLDGKALRAGLDRLFPRLGLGKDELDHQRMAALVAVARRFCIISGGPGTGKTTTVVKILALLAEQALLAKRSKLHVTLVAPTGKAAARLREAILEQREKLKLDAKIGAMVPDETSTIHRALKPVPGSLNRFRHNASNPLPTDLVLVDEASMVDLALMSRLVDALPAHARLILLGDRNQLASVEAGAILGDLCGPPRDPGFSASFAKHVGKLTGDTLPVDKKLQGAGIADCVVQLRRNYRYPDGSGIAMLAQAINDGDVERVAATLAQGHADVTHLPSPPKVGLGAELRARAVQGYAGYLRETSERACFEAFGRFRVLTALRRGPHGVEALNPLIAEALAEERLLRPRGVWYPRRPVMVTENDYQVSLFNGDVGMILPDPDDDGADRAWFFAPEGGVRKLAPSRLPPHETVFAMTVHKAQGSEFDEVAVVLPGESSPVLTRELLYTAVTRPKKRVVIFGDAGVIAAAVARPIERASGLRGRLWG